MADKLFLAFVIMDFLFVVTGGLIIGFSLKMENEMVQTPTAHTIARNLLLGRFHLTGAIVNAIMIFVTFLISLPAIAIPTSRGWLKLFGYMVTVCAIFTLVLGLDVWFDTLKTRANLSVTWNLQPLTSQSLLQQELDCCGYFNSTSPPFVTDSICPDAAAAALKKGCVGPFSSFANVFLDLIFTALFGSVGIDVALILAIACLLKDRKEQERYRVIDEKNGSGSF